MHIKSHSHSLKHPQPHQFKHKQSDDFFRPDDVYDPSDAHSEASPFPWSRENSDERGALI